eukprot:11133501-Lingulodinium_polyedra.AAC.1
MQFQILARSLNVCTYRRASNTNKHNMFTRSKGLAQCWPCEAMPQLRHQFHELLDIDDVVNHQAPRGRV